MQLYNTCLTFIPFTIDHEKICVQNKRSLVLRNERKIINASCVILMSKLTPGTRHTSEPSHITNVPTRRREGEEILMLVC